MKYFPIRKNVRDTISSVMRELTPTSAAEDFPEASTEAVSAEEIFLKTCSAVFSAEEAV